MYQMSKEDQADRQAYYWWAKTRIRKSKKEVMDIEIWNAACAYKDKRIAELEDGFQEIIAHIEHGTYLNEIMDIAQAVLSEGGADE
jgi:hypothetical protein